MELITIRNVELEATIVEKYAAVEGFLDERGRMPSDRCSGFGRDGIVAPDHKGRGELKSAVRKMIV